MKSTPYFSKIHFSIILSASTTPCNLTMFEVQNSPGFCQQWLRRCCTDCLLSKRFCMKCHETGLELSKMQAVKPGWEAAVHRMTQHPLRQRKVTIFSLMLITCH